MTDKRVNFHMDNELFVAVKMKLLQEGTTMTAILVEYLNDYAGLPGKPAVRTVDMILNDYIRSMREEGHPLTPEDIQEMREVIIAGGAPQ